MLAVCKALMAMLSVPEYTKGIHIIAELIHICIVFDHTAVLVLRE